MPSKSLFAIHKTTYKLLTLIILAWVLCEHNGHESLGDPFVLNAPLS